MRPGQQKGRNCSGSGKAPPVYAATKRGSEWKNGGRQQLEKQRSQGKTFSKDKGVCALIFPVKGKKSE